MVILSEKKINSVSFLASDDYRYVIESHSNGMMIGSDTLTGKTTAQVPTSHMSSVLADMKELFHQDFTVKTEALTSKDIRAKADSLKRRGYSCVYDMIDSSVTITDKKGNTVFTAVGKQVDSIIQSFEEDPASLDTTLSIEDYILVRFV